MPSATSLVQALNEGVISRLIGVPHDNARVSFPLASVTVDSWARFEDVIADYYRHHKCSVCGGAVPSEGECRSHAKELVEREYRRSGGDIVSAYRDSHDGRNGGLRHVLDIIADGLKAEAVTRYTRDQFDRRVSPVDYDEKVALIRDFFSCYGNLLDEDVRLDRPEQYAQDYRDVVEGFVAGLRQMSPVFRRL